MIRASWSLPVPTAFPHRFFAQDFTGLLAAFVANTSAENTVKGLAVLKTAIPHFNVWVTQEAGLPLFHGLARRFTLPEIVGGDPESENVLKKQSDSQVEMTMAEVMAVIAAEDAREHRTSIKVRQGIA